MMNQEKLSIEAKIKKLDEQIAMLTKLKLQYSEKLNGLSNEEVVPGTATIIIAMSKTILNFSSSLRIY